MERPDFIQLDDKKNLSRLQKNGTVFINTIKNQLRELCAVRHPHLRGKGKAVREVENRFVEEYKKKEKQWSIWVFYPWSNKAVRFLEEPLHEELRTARNKYLITADEQELFRDFPVAIAGLSVGSHAALSIALQGGGKYMRLADPDAVSGSNLNRIRAGFESVGVNKAVVAAREIYAINPYARLAVDEKGVNEKTMKNFLTKPRRARVLIDEMDDLPFKFILRKEARKLGIPVIMATDNGDGIILSIERFDTNRSLKLFHGRVKELSRIQLNALTPHQAAEIIATMIGPKAVRKRMYESVSQIGKTLYSWPQLGGAAQLAGVALAYATRMIATGGPLKSGRTIISLEKIL